MNRAEKTQAIEGLQKEFTEAGAVFLTDYRGLKVNKLTELRFELNKAGASFRVIKNRLALRALEPETAKSMETHFDDMTAVTIARGDVASSAKVLTKFAKNNENLKIKVGLLDGKIISVEEITALSKLPSRQELLAQLLGVWTAVPAGFVRVLNAVPAGWVNVLDSLRRKRDSGGA